MQKPQGETETLETTLDEAQRCETETALQLRSALGVAPLHPAVEALLRAREDRMAKLTVVQASRSRGNNDLAMIQEVPFRTALLAEYGLMLAAREEVTRQAHAGVMSFFWEFDGFWQRRFELQTRIIAAAEVEAAAQRAAKKLRVARERVAEAAGG